MLIVRRSKSNEVKAEEVGMLEMLKKYKRFLMVDMLSISWVNCKITIRIKMVQCMHFFRLVLGKIGDIYPSKCHHLGALTDQHRWREDQLMAEMMT